MVHLDRITTKTGDAGTTRLGDGSEVSKHSQRIEVLGTIDELNAHLGMALATNIPEPYCKWLSRVQNDLFDLGAEICYPDYSSESTLPGIRPGDVSRLELWLDQLHKKLPPLNSFILPGGTMTTAAIHLARTVCRRTERELWKLAEQEKISDQPAIYLNRLSDLLFQLARRLDNPDQPAPLWVPSQK